MWNLNDGKLAELHQRDLLHDAVERRRWASLLAEGNATRRVPALDRLGILLIAWGQRLQARSGLLEHARS